MLIHTIADLDAVPPARMWQLLRTLRHRPPGYALRGQRRDTFNAALEQAEQLFVAAERVGPSTRPILIFYGVSQIGRAVAAVSTALTNNSYRLSTHGLHDGDLGSVVPGELHKLTIGANPSGAFPAVATALGASTMQQDRTIGELWGLIPDAGRFPLPGAGGLQAIMVQPKITTLPTNTARIRVSVDPLPLSLLGVDATEDTVANLLRRSIVDEPLIARQRTLLADWLTHYPTLSTWTFGVDGVPWSPIGFGLADDGRSLIAPLDVPVPSHQSHHQAIAAATCRYHQIVAAYPRLDSEPLAGHPFLLWWAVLYCLSRLARYEPRAWNDLTNVARSPDAAAIEYLLAEALIALPELAYEAIYRAAGATGEVEV